MRILILAMLACCGIANAADRVVDIPTRPGVTQRFVLITPPGAKAAVVLFAGGDGGLQISESGAYTQLRGNFLVRSAQLFAAQQLVVAVIDAPSDKQSYPFLGGFRQTAEHATDVKAVIAWLREHTKLPVWLIGTSRGTQSVAAVATRLAPADGPDGIVLTSTLFTDPRGRAVPEMALEKLTIPVLVVHHEQDGCKFTLYRDAPRVMEKLTAAPRKELVAFRGGENVGDPCQAQSHHGFRAIEQDVVARISGWILMK